ncbi:hypothetical protein N1851_016615 [Merluccius polli]|uniref:Uncharacterized protein n=1 Tax=Merluccius polli TaxID=89951 RepID=A0AA47P2T8_MERPO|nr:hypothetical protein N1851_016615 [Merluccius polli]
MQATVDFDLDDDGLCHIPPNADAQANRGAPTQVTRKQELDEALVSMIVGDTQPFTIVEDPGFRNCVAKLDPTYVIPTRKAVKAMVKEKYGGEAEGQTAVTECNYS